MTVDGAAASLLYVSSGQINLQVPDSVEGSTTLSLGSGPGASRSFVVANGAPSVFLDLTVSPSSGCPFYVSPAFGAVSLNADGSRNTCANPARPGSAVTVFLNGTPVWVYQVSVSSGNVSLASGPVTPVAGAPGVDQLTIQLPPATISGTEGIGLEIAIDGLPAAPFYYSGAVYQAAVVVWMQP